MNRTTKKKECSARKKSSSARKSSSESADVRLLVGAIRKAAREERERIATALVDSAKEGNNTALKALLDVVTRTDAPKEPSRAESLKLLEQMENDAEYGELSEETADGYPSGREPE